MLKKLFFMAALLMPGLVYGASPSADLSVQVVPASSPPPPNGIACDIGPNYAGSIPAAAAKAGFTHCAANYDFTQAQSFTDILGTHQWSSLASWFACNPLSSGSWLWGYIPYYNGVGCDTSHQNIITDSGTQVWALTYHFSDFQAGNYNNFILTGGSYTNIQGPTFPAEHYVERVMRVSTTNPCSGSCITYTTEMTGYDQTHCYWEDLDEVSAGGSTTNSAIDFFNCGGGGGTALSTQTPAPTIVYSTYGHLQTADDVDSMAVCNYYSAGVVSGLPSASWKSCELITGISGLAASPFSARHQMGNWQGPEAAAPWTTDYVVYFQRQTVWVCPNPTGGTWNTTGQCWTPVVTGP